ncbi:MAG: hypothetical protein E7168_04500 [Firmicutes bacterium]|nr:hypothetical protein [Bacillota bacterium]
MKYKWNYLELLQNLSFLEQLLKTETDPERIGMIEDSLNSYESMLVLGLPSFLQHFTSPCLDNKNIGERILTESETQIVKCILSSKEIIDSFIETDDSILDFPIFYKKETLISYTKDLFQSEMPSEIYMFLLNFLEKKRKLHIRKNHDLHNSIYGLFLYDAVLENKFILINQKGNYLDFSSLSHELLHAYYIPSNYQEIFFNDIFYTKETEGSFSDFINAEYFKTIDPKIAYLLRKQFFDSFRLSLFELEDEYFKYYNDGKIILPENTSSNIDELILLSFSYLIALDFFEIFKQDKNLSFELLRKLKNTTKTENIFEDLKRLDVSFMDDGFKNLKQLKKCLEIKKI